MWRNFCVHLLLVVLTTSAVPSLGRPVQQVRQPLDDGPTPAPQECDKPNWWCADTNQKLTRSDCDGDRTLDWVCTDDRYGARGVILSSRRCDFSESATGWPSANSSLCPQVLSGPPCARPNWWCGDPATQVLSHTDCDGDGVLDWVCVEPASGSRGALISSAGCDAYNAGWPSAPASWCPSVFSGPACSRPNWWCADQNQTVTHTDCDGDGILDWVCEDPSSGSRGALISTAGCDVGNSSWPNAPISWCPTVFTSPACSRPNWWCAGQNETLTHTDCDGDGVLDWVCVDSVSGSRGALISTAGCDVYNSSWPDAPVSWCPTVFTGPVCSRPSWWCADNSSQILTQTDCDGDGVLDWVCVEPPTGSRGVLLSSAGCDVNKSNWPSAAISLCPAVFTGPACSRPNWWCADPTQQILTHTDCDGDGVLDWVCSEPATGSRGALISSAGCDAYNAGWPSAPASWCPSVFSGPACSRPNWWCGEPSKHIVTHTDCDGDGILDWVCNEPATGGRGVLLSTLGCNISSEATAWPSAPSSLCPSVFQGPPCARPPWWCADATSQLSTAFDCDGDGTLDWVCTEPISGNRGVLLSSSGCDMDHSGWPNAPVSTCPGLFE